MILVFIQDKLLKLKIVGNQTIIGVTFDLFRQLENYLLLFDNNISSFWHISYSLSDLSTF